MSLTMVIIIVIVVLGVIVSNIMLLRYSAKMPMVKKVLNSETPSKPTAKQPVDHQQLDDGQNIQANAWDDEDDDWPKKH